MKYKYVFFDWGYTLIDSFKNTDNEINEILNKYNLKWDDVFRYWKNYQILNSLGKITEEEIYTHLSLILKISESDLKKIDMLLLDSHILSENTKELIIELYKNGYYLGIISNNSKRNINYILEREDIKKYFKKIIISEEVKERKPNLKVYLRGFEEIPKDEFEKIAFVSDELTEDLLGAKILGITTIWYEQELENKWKKKEEIFIEPDYKIKNMKDILRIV